MAKHIVTMLIGAGLCWLICGTLNQRATAEPAKDSDVTIRSSPSMKIALVDMARLFTSSKSFSQHRDALKAKILESEDVAKKMNSEMADLQKKMKGLDRSSDEFRELERDLKSRQHEFEDFKKEKSREFVKIESAIYLKLYQAAIREISSYAETHGIDLVIRDTSEPLENEDPSKMLQNMNRMVLYENKLDITDEIIAALSDL